jgi:hypothetical protein
MTDEQEQELATRIANQLIDPGFLYTDADFKINAFHFCPGIVCGIEGGGGERELTDQETRKILTLAASPKFIQVHVTTPIVQAETKSNPGKHSTVDRRSPRTLARISPRLNRQS